MSMNPIGIKPKLNSCVYLLSMDTVSRVVVLAKGVDLFFHSLCANDVYVEDVRKPLYYKDYGITWCKTLKEAKAHYKGILVKKANDYWEVYD